MIKVCRQEAEPEAGGGGAAAASEAGDLSHKMLTIGDCEYSQSPKYISVPHRGTVLKSPLFL